MGRPACFLRNSLAKALVWVVTTVPIFFFPASSFGHASGSFSYEFDGLVDSIQIEISDCPDDREDCHRFQAPLASVGRLAETWYLEKMWLRNDPFEAKLTNKTTEDLIYVTLTTLPENQEVKLSFREEDLFGVLWDPDYANVHRMTLIFSIVPLDGVTRLDVLIDFRCTWVGAERVSWGRIKRAQSPN